MRTKRALMAGVVAGLGTTGTMVASAASLFFVASTLIAFNSWSHSAISDRVQSLFVGDQESSGAVAPPAPRVVATRAAAPVRSRELPARPRPAARPSERVSDTGPAGTPADPNPVPVVGGDGRGPLLQVFHTGSAPSPRPVTGGSHSEGAPAPADHPVAPTLGGVVQNTTDTLADTVEQTTGQLGSTLGGVNQPLGNVVTQTGQTLGNTISQTGQTISQTLGNTVNQTGQTLNGHR